MLYVFLYGTSGPFSHKIHQLQNIVILNIIL